MTNVKRLASVLACALALSAALALPASGAPISGGVSAPEGSEHSGGLTLDASHAFVGRSARFTGTVPEADAGRSVLIQRRTGDGWETIATTNSERDGTFTASWQAERPGAYTVRAVLGSARVAEGESASPSVDRLIVYRTAKATWYGSAMYGRTTACGQTLSSTLVGTAHKTLPCGTRVAFYYKGRRVVAPVVDRGPYAGDRAFDLTYAAARRIGMISDGVGVVGYLSLGR